MHARSLSKSFCLRLALSQISFPPAPLDVVVHCPQFQPFRILEKRRLRSTDFYI